MKSLPNYEKKQADFFASMGAFFCYSEKQFNDEKTEGVEYTTVSGLACPKENEKKLLAGFEKIYKENISYKLANNTKKELIWDSLSNFEVQITGSLVQTMEALKELGITEDEVRAESPSYHDYCVENDLF